MSPSESQVELLSAYIDGELPSDESTRVEELLERDPELRLQLAGMRAVTHDLAHLKRMAPPPTLGQDVARRIALAGERRSLLDRIEDGLSGVQQQSNIFLMFAVIFSLSTIMYFFFHGLERNKLTPVTFVDPAEALAADDIENASTLFVAERFFQRQGDVWIEEGLDEAAVISARRLEPDVTAQLIADRADLGSLAQLGTVVLRLNGEVLELVFAKAP